MRTPVSLVSTGHEVPQDVKLDGLDGGGGEARWRRALGVRVDGAVAVVVDPVGAVAGGGGLRSVGVPQGVGVVALPAGEPGVSVRVVSPSSAPPWQSLSRPSQTSTPPGTLAGVESSQSAQASVIWPLSPVRSRPSRTRRGCARLASATSRPRRHAVVHHDHQRPQQGPGLRLQLDRRCHGDHGRLRGRDPDRRADLHRLGQRRVGRGVHVGRVGVDGHGDAGAGDVRRERHQRRARRHRLRRALSSAERVADARRRCADHRPRASRHRAEEHAS
jgi:hypothetical protein